ncbi:MAG: MarR family transcriptional regulator [Stappiaceae bacterium]
MTVSKIEHIGWDLWQASHAWKQRFTREMRAQGFGWYGEARANLIQHIGPGGIAQIELAARAGITKQAVQQQLDELVLDGILERVSDASDARKKHIHLTPAGIDALTKTNEIKARIERDYEKLIGPLLMREVKKALNMITSSENPEQN